MPIRIVRLGEPREENEGVRIGTVRRPPRGVPANRFAKDDWYDVWYPELSPTAALVTKALSSTDDKTWRAFVKKFPNFSIGCYCEDESHCHRSVLRALLEERGADIA